MKLMFGKSISDTDGAHLLKPTGVLGRLKDSITSKPLAFSIVINSLVLVLCLLFGTVRFEINDDSGMQDIACGVYGTPSQYLVFMNIAYGYILKFLIGIAPSIPWYPLLFIVFIFASLCTVTFLILKKNVNLGFLFSMVLLVFFAPELYITLQFTEVTAVLTVAGVLLMIDACTAEKLSAFKLILSAILIVLGSCIRFDAFLMGCGTIGVFALYTLVKLIKEKSTKKIIKCIICFCLALVICFGLKIFNDKSYSSSQEWNEYTSFNYSRSRLLDYDFPYYPNNEGMYTELGISDEDVRLFRLWDFADPDVFNLNSAKTIADAKESTKFDLNLIKSFIYVLPQFLEYAFIPAFILIAVFSLIINKKSIPWLILQLVLLLAMEFYLFYSGRYLQPRVDVGLIFGITTSLSLIVLEFTIKKKERKSSRFLSAGVLILSAVLIILSISEWGTNIYKYKKSEIKPDISLTEVITSDKENLYIKSTVTSLPSSNSIWSPPKAGLYSNICSLGGWLTYSPIANNIKASYGIYNPFKEVVDNENAYLIHDETQYSITMLINYIQRHYNENAQLQKAKCFGDIDIYKVVSEPIEISGVSELLPEKLNYDFSTEVSEDTITVSGYAFVEGESSYQANAYVSVKYDDGITETQYLTQGENEDLSGDLNGQYSLFSGEITVNTEKSYSVSVYYEHSGEIYLLLQK